MTIDVALTLPDLRQNLDHHVSRANEYPAAKFLFVYTLSHV